MNQHVLSKRKGRKEGKEEICQRLGGRGVIGKRRGTCKKDSWTGTMGGNCQLKNSHMSNQGCVK